MEKTLKDILAPNLRILFVGFNPGLRSAEIGHYFAHRNNKFWDLLYQARITPRRLEPEEDYLMPSLGYGMTDIVKRASKGAADLKKEEFALGKIRLRKVIEEYKPKIVCYLGIGIYKEFAGLKQVQLGLQKNRVVEEVMDFVAPSPSGLNMLPLKEKLVYFLQLKKLLDDLE